MNPPDVRGQTIAHYEALIDENNDPVYDGPLAQAYMDKWDGPLFIEQLRLSGAKDLLEIGVGTGRLALRTAGRCKNFCGIDLSPKTIGRARENLREFLNVALICADFLEHRFDRTFDTIYSSLTFMHIREKKTAFGKTASLLNPGGRFVLSVSKNRDPVLVFEDRTLTLYPDTPEETERLMGRAGLVTKNRFETEFAYICAAEKL